MPKYYRPFTDLAFLGKSGMTPDEIFSGEQEEIGSRANNGFTPIEEIADPNGLTPEDLLLLAEEMEAIML